ncbi:MAG: class I SAM-dependent methyltransferase [Candidatus Helarchaeota archaeon]
MNVNFDIFRGKLFVKFIRRYFKDISSIIALDVGCRYGALLIEMAKNFKKVIGIDIDDDALEIIRKKTEKFENVVIRKENVLRTNFNDNTFDLITLEGVLEWVGLSNPSISPKECQIQALEECKRILKPNGILYCGIENKLYPPHWFKDPHSYLPLTVILPRKLAQFYYECKTKTDFKYYGQKIYSYWGYVKIFSKVFGSCDIKIPLPNYKYLYYISSLNSKDIIKNAKKALSIKNLRKTYKATTLSNLAFSALGLKYFSNDFIILCRKRE